MILSLYGRIRDCENLHSRIFYAVYCGENRTILLEPMLLNVNYSFSLEKYIVLFARFTEIKSYEFLTNLCITILINYYFFTFLYDASLTYKILS